jgi:hypothetical protein
MKSCSEIVKLREIQYAIKHGIAVSNADRQWVIDLCKREQTPVLLEVAIRATADGFDTAGLVTI